MQSLRRLRGPDYDSEAELKEMQDLLDKSEQNKVKHSN